MAVIVTRRFPLHVALDRPGLAPHPVPSKIWTGAVMEWVHLSAAMSLDGHIDVAEGPRLVLSGEEDCRDMHAARAECQAILVGAGTVRRDHPRLTIRYADLVAGRRQRGWPDHPIKLVLTRTGDLDPASAFFHEGGTRIVLCPEPRASLIRDRLGGVAQVVGLADEGVPALLHGMRGLGIGRLMVEGGSQVLTQFLVAGAFHRLRLAVAPFLVGQGDAPRLTGPGRFIHGPDRRLIIRATRTLGNIAVIDMDNPDPIL